MVAFQENEVKEAWEDILQDKYRLAIQEIADCYPEKRSVHIDYTDLDLYNTNFAMFLLENPDLCLNIGRSVVNSLMPSGWDDKRRVNLRIINLPNDSLVDIRKLRENHLGKLVSVQGLAKKVSSVKPRLTYAKFTCSRCGAVIWEPQSGMYLREPMGCPNPNGSCNKGINRFIMDSKCCHYIDTQKIEIQESPEGLRGGQQPEKISGYVEDDLAGVLTAGNRITLNAIVRPVEKSERDKSTIFEIYLDVLWIGFEQHEYDKLDITEEDEEKIKSTSKDPLLFEHIVKSIAPTIYGMDEVKKAIALQLFGGCQKRMDDGTTIRGDTHILLIGDPGVAKSQILRYMSLLAPRAIFSSGKSASAAGLTAAAVKDDFGGDGYTLEAGALVLADKGLACIDELDKMSEQDTSSLHEAMESQKISVAKAGITATLQCRCSLLAAANPKYGRFDQESETLSSQINLPPALISRFDLIFVLTDNPEEKMDRKITQFILNVHQRGQALQYPNQESLDGLDLKAIRDNTSNIKPYFEQEFLRKYVAYSKRIVPVMKPEAAKMIENAYMEIRMSGKDKKTIPITARQLEAYVRLSEASAKMRLSHFVEAQDAQRAIELVSHYLQKINGGDIDKFINDTSSKQRKDQMLVMGIIESAGGPGISLDELISLCGQEGFTEGEVRKMLKNMENNAMIYSPSTDHYKKV